MVACVVSSPDPLDLPAQLTVAHTLARRGLLADDALRAIDAPPGPAAWAVFADRLLLFLGTALVLAGVVYFFAFNWDALGRFLQFGLLEAGIALAAVGAWLRRDRMSGQALLIAASVGVGPLLAVFGQVYQTGADPWGLFFGWSALTIGWACLARSGGLWLLQVALWNVTLGLYWEEIVAPDTDAMEMYGVAIAIAINLLAWVGWEAGRVAGIAWMQARWTARTLAAAVVLPAAAVTAAWLAESHREPFGGGPAALLLVAAWVGIYWFGRVRSLDRTLLLEGAIGMLIVTSTVMGRVVWEVCDRVDDPLVYAIGMLIVGLAVVGQVGLMAAWVTRLKPADDAPEVAA